jgi:exo-beta-1,3-glucanase (GH17 family)
MDADGVSVDTSCAPSTGLEPADRRVRPDAASGLRPRTVVVIALMLGAGALSFPASVAGRGDGAATPPPGIDPGRETTLVAGLGDGTAALLQPGTGRGQATTTQPAPGPRDGAGGGADAAVSQPRSTMLVGADIYQLAPTSEHDGVKAGPDVSAMVKTVRMAGTEQAAYSPALPNSAIEAWQKIGVNVIVMDGSGNKNGIGAESPAAWAARCVERAKAHPAAIEEGNEVYGSWFWGPNATSEAAANAYIALLKGDREAMDKAYGRGNYPPLLASTEGGPEEIGWTKMLAAKGLAKYVDGVAVHPYFAREPRSSALLGHRDRVLEVHAITGLPVWVTEIGWTTSPQAAPYLQFSPTEQAEAITGFVDWAQAQGTGVVAAVSVYAYEERGEGYGLVDDSWRHKPAYAALQAAGPEPEAESETAESPSRHNGAAGTRQPGIDSGLEPLDYQGSMLLGAKLVRIEFPVQTPTSQLESAVGGYAAKGIRVLLLAGFKGTLPTPAQAQGLGRWAAVFGPGGTFWSNHPGGAAAVQDIEFGNETSYGYQYGDSPGSTSYRERSENYARRFKEAAVAITATGEAVGLLAQADDSTGNWVNGMYTAVPELGRYVAGWTIHPYHKWRSRMEALVEQTKAHGDTTKPIDVTEFGLPTDKGRCLGEDEEYNPCMRESEAAKILRGTVKKIRRLLGGRLSLFVVYQVRDQRKSGTSSNGEMYYGALQQELQPKGEYTEAVEAVLAGG